jgi:hypothetical protein
MNELEQYKQLRDVLQSAADALSEIIEHLEKENPDERRTEELLGRFMMIMLKLQAMQ